jgi:precorrin-8X/cobalt-precorrin-8 methylmutase
VPAEPVVGSTLLQRYGLPPAEVERLSLARLETLAGAALPQAPDERHLAARILYAAGDPTLAAHLDVHPRAVGAGVASLGVGAGVVVDVGMVAAGVRRARLAGPLLVALDQPGVQDLALAASITRSAAAMRLVAPRLGGCVVAIGNAPTALLELLDQLDGGGPRPALIIGMPVGLVAAAESKIELARRAIPYVTVHGARGGSPLAAAALNALLDLSHGR